MQHLRQVAGLLSHRRQPLQLRIRVRQQAREPRRGHRPEPGSAFAQIDARRTLGAGLLLAVKDYFPRRVLLGWEGDAVRLYGAYNDGTNATALRLATAFGQRWIGSRLPNRMSKYDSVRVCGQYPLFQRREYGPAPHDSADSTLVSTTTPTRSPP